MADLGPGTLRLRTPEHLVSRKAILWWSLTAGIGWLFLLAIPVGLLVTGISDDPVMPVVTAVLAGLAVVHVAVMPQWRYRVHRWETTPDAVYTLSGWLRQEWRVAPVSRIQTVDTKRGPLEQLLGLATVTVTTASAAGPLSVAGLDHDTAVRVVDELTSRTQAVPGDAT
jgi:membrane protein YdbS with pleckstrin-like domain